jgi:general secretion pathway protein G
MTRGRLSFARHRGFTLIELVVVMTIITILAGAVALQVTHRVQNARRARALQDISVLESALDMYAADSGQPPTTQQGLEALRREPSSPPLPRNWDGPYIKKAVPTDPWGNDYEYKYPGQANPDGYDIICYGRDGRPGGDGPDEDMTNYEME